MDESRMLMVHMYRLMQHVKKYSKTTDVWDVLAGKPIGDGPADVRDAFIKLRKLQHRYEALFRKAGGRLKDEDEAGQPFLRMSNCTAREVVWVLDSWRKGQWRLLCKEADGYYLVVRFSGGKFQRRKFDESQEQIHLVDHSE